MKSRWWITCLLVGCSSSNSPEPSNVDAGADTFVSGPIDLQIDTYNVALAGTGVDVEAERRPVLLTELGKLSGDIVCLQEVWQESDKLAVRDAMKAHYAYAAWPKTDRTTKIDDPTDQEGKTPPAPKAPCAGLESELDTGIACLANNCSTIPGSAEGKVTTTSCAKEKCVADVVGLFGADDKTCYSCLATNLASEKIKDIAGACKTPGYPQGFGGQSSPMLLSKYPLTDVEQRVVPGCWQQRSVIRATANLPNGAKLDVYCNHLSPVIDDAFIPYTCPWGGTATADKDRWAAEQLLQAQKIIAWSQTRPKGRLVFLGDLNASPVVPSDTTIQSYGTATLDLLGKTWVEALAASYTPKCTFCRSNPLTKDTENTWLDHVFLGSIDKSAVKSTTVTFDQAIVDTPTYTAKKVPTSDHFGIRTVVTIAP